MQLLMENDGQGTLLTTTTGMQPLSYCFDCCVLRQTAQKVVLESTLTVNHEVVAVGLASNKRSLRVFPLLVRSFVS